MVRATIRYHQGTDTVEDFHSIVEMDNGDDIRVWFSDPDGDGLNSDYVDYPLGAVVEVEA